MADPPAVSRWQWLTDGTALHVHHHPTPRPTPRAVVVVFHGGGGHGRMLAPFAVAAQQLGCEVLALDLPGYGHTVVPDPSGVTYQQWIDASVQVVEAAAGSDAPVILVGASMGGRLALDVAHQSTAPVAEAIVTCLLDPRLASHRRAAARTPALGALGPSVLGLAPRVTDRLRVPIGWLAPIRLIANSPALARTCATDPLGAASRVPLGFIRSWLQHPLAYEPETFAACRVTLTHPGDDRWTPLELSQRWFERLATRGDLVVLEGCGHFPVEQPGIDQLRHALAGAIDRATSGDR
ncbi:MAG: alpha/beta fold hydrolase [Acidimicrobiia bacterium]|nr:alpha/beta fold hydrolase [Acidimicrobiia bacterium]